jgi:flagellar biosynthesis anti-sigma factor FlgM
MQIPSMLSRASLLFQATSASPKATSAAQAETSTPRTSDGVSVKVSSQAADLAREARTVNHARVDELRQRFAQGAFSVDHLSLARSMLAQS